MTNTLFSMRILAAIKRLVFSVPLLLCCLRFLSPSSSAQIIQTNFGSTNIIHFQSANYFASEDSLFATITLVRDGPLTNFDFVTVDFSMIDGTAITGVHYYRQNGTAFFQPGQATAQFFVSLIDNFAAGGNVSLTLLLSNPQNGVDTLAVLGTPSTATLTILDDETAPTSSSAGVVEIAPGNGYGVSGYVGTKEEWNVDLNDNANFTPYGPPGIVFTIIRKGGSKGRILVD